MDKGWMNAAGRPLADLGTDRPHAARIYDYLLGGKTNYPADRRAAEQLLKAMPDAVRTATANRAFMHRAVRFLAGAGVEQFLDIGTGIPTSPNLHETAQEIRPAARIVYADNDPIVLAHSRALHVGTAEGATAYVEGDLRDPRTILGSPALTGTLELSRPVAVMLLTVLHWIGDACEPYGIVRQLMDAVPSGSYLVVSHVAADLDPESVGAAARDLNASGRGHHDVTPRPRDGVERFFAGLEMTEPGLVLAEQWRPDPGEAVLRAVGAEHPLRQAPVYVGVARKP